MVVRLGLLVATLSSLCLAWPDSSPVDLTESIKRRIESDSMHLPGVPGSSPRWGKVQEFYQSREYRPAWLTENASSLTQQLFRVLSNARSEGLDPAMYLYPAIRQKTEEFLRKRQRAASEEISRAADLELWLTWSFISYATHLAQGRIDPRLGWWQLDAPVFDPLAVLSTALEQARIEPALQALAPPHAGYIGLKRALQHYQEVALKGGWQAIPGGAVLRKGQKGQRVLQLRRRLSATGDLQTRDLEEDLSTFDASLEQAVRLFQERCGLVVDGIVGRQTLTALNRPVEDRIRQIMLNLERWRWLPRPLEDRSVIVNVAEAVLRAFDRHGEVLETRVIVGHPNRQTRLFKDQIETVILNPYWHVPESIVRRTVLPQARRNPDYLRRKHLEVVVEGNETAGTVDPSRIQWSRVNANSIPYSFRQKPGPWNSLGRFKFEFPNRFNIYVHDTPDGHLFGRDDRALSSGCIRVEQPLDLAEFLLQDQLEWTEETIKRTIQAGKSVPVDLLMPVPIYIVLWSVWTDENGTVQFRQNDYGHDQILERALLNAR